jgi:hypothetical protein
VKRKDERILIHRNNSTSKFTNKENSSLHRMSMLEGNKELQPPKAKLVSPLPLRGGKTDQNLRVSSPAPVTMF